MSKTNTTTPTRSTATDAPDYAIPDPQEAWGRFDRLVGKVLQASGDGSKHITQTMDQPVSESNK